jgi:hypothetical protein
MRWPPRRRCWAGAGYRVRQYDEHRGLRGRRSGRGATGSAAPGPAVPWRRSRRRAYLSRLRARLGFPLPVLILSASRSIELGMAAYREGAARVLAKPISAEALLHHVTDTLAAREIPARTTAGGRRTDGGLARFIANLDDPLLSFTSALSPVTSRHGWPKPPLMQSSWTIRRKPPNERGRSSRCCTTTRNPHTCPSWSSLQGRTRSDGPRPGRRAVPPSSMHRWPLPNSARCCGPCAARPRAAAEMRTPRHASSTSTRASARHWTITRSSAWPTPPAPSSRPRPATARSPGSPARS